MELLREYFARAWIGLRFHFGGVEAHEVKIILVDWVGYSIRRKKRLGNYSFLCGLEQNLKGMRQYYAGCVFRVILVINDAVSYEYREKNAPLFESLHFLEKVIYRASNQGRDFGAYDAGYQYLKKTGYQGDVVFMNSSARGPRYPYWLVRYQKLFYAQEKIGVCGVSINSHGTHIASRPFDPHVQSFFLYTNMSILRTVFPDELPAATEDADYCNIISKGEIEFSRRLLAQGYGISSKMFDGFIYRIGKSQTWYDGDTRFSGRYKYLANLI